MEEVFSSFEPNPIGAASIGQVHRAVLAPSQSEKARLEELQRHPLTWSEWAGSFFGYKKRAFEDALNTSIAERSVVVKLQYPEVTESHPVPRPLSLPLARFGATFFVLHLFCAAPLLCLPVLCPEFMPQRISGRGTSPVFPHTMTKNNTLGL